MSDQKQIGGDHYSRMAIQPVDFYESVSKEHYEGFCRFNAIKYLSRYDSKGQPLQDLAKAQHYIEMLTNIVASGIETGGTESVRATQDDRL